MYISILALKIAKVKETMGRKEVKSYHFVNFLGESIRSYVYNSVKKIDFKE